MINSERVHLSINTDDKMIEYQGRCLGLLTPEEYRALTESVDLRRKILNVRVVTLSQISEQDLTETIGGKQFRLCMSVDKKKGPVEPKKILVTAPIQFITGVNNGVSVSLRTTDDSIVELKVIEDKNAK